MDMVIKTLVSASAHRQGEAASKPANSILATAETAWDLDVAHKEAETERKGADGAEQPARQDPPASAR